MGTDYRKRGDEGQTRRQAVAAGRQAAAPYGMGGHKIVAMDLQPPLAPAHSPNRRRLLAASLALLAAGRARSTEMPALNAVENMRARVEAARQLSIPKPPPGVRDLRWNELSPPGWNPGHFLQELDLGKLGDSDPRAVQAMTKVRQEWDAAPAVTFADDGPVRLTGFPILLDPGQGLSRAILLVPYYGACIHRPSPPANQMVMVVLKNGLPRNMDGLPIWVLGRIYTARNNTQYGKVAYTVTEGSWIKYPLDKYPMPQYIALR